MSWIPKLNRRDFIITPCALISTGIVCNTISASAGTGLSEAQHKSLMLALEQTDSKYDEDEQMVRGGASSVGYHTTLKAGTPVHHTRGSLQYAAALMESGVDWRIGRAKKIIRKVVSLQDQNPENKTYGIWSWYLEEPLEEMSPPDWNWADFCSVQLLKVWIDHQDLLEDDLKTLIQDSIIHAAHSIKRRNVGPGYTNIAMMGTYVTVTVGERMDESEIHQYGKDRLRRVHKFTMDNGSFREYNSSTYTVVAIAEISRMLMHFQNEEDRKLAADMHDLAWKHLATHFHAPTRQLAGPQSRCYSTDLSKRESTLAFLEIATGATGMLLQEDPLPMGLEHSTLKIHCPEEFREMFFKLDEPREVVEVFSKESNPDRKDVIGTTYLHPLYTLGSVNRGDFWIQRRPILAYWGTKEKPTYLQVRFLKDNYDFSSAIPISVQKGNRLLTVVAFATDYGDTHISLDKVKDATIKAKDLRLRFEFGGNLDDLQLSNSNQGKTIFVMKHDKVRMGLDMFASAFDGHEIQFEINEENQKKSVDLICYHSEEESVIRLDELQESFIAFVMDIHENAGMSFAHDAKRDGDVFSAGWKQHNGPEGELPKLQVPIRPAKLGAIHHGYKVF